MSFLSIVSESFSFLENKYGYNKKINTENDILYKKDNLFLNVAYDNLRSFEIFIYVGQIVDNEIIESYSINHIFSCYNISMEILPHGFQTSSLDVLKKIIEKCALAIKQYDDLILINLDFKNLSNFEEYESHKYDQERRLKYAKEDAEIAWKNKNYNDVILALNPVKTLLNKSELMKLLYCEKKLKSMPRE